MTVEEVDGYRDGAEGQDAAYPKEHHENVDQIALVGKVLVLLLLRQRSEDRRINRERLLPLVG